MVVAVAYFTQRLARNALGVPGLPFRPRTPPAALLEKSAARRVMAQLAGPLVAYVLLVGFFAGLERERGEMSTVVAVRPGFPADRAGLKNHDRIIAVEDRPVRTFPEVQQIVATSPSNELRVTVERGEKRETFLLQREPRAPIGVQAIEVIPRSTASIFASATTLPIRSFLAQATLIGRAISGRMPVRNLFGPKSESQTEDRSLALVGWGLAHAGSLIWPLTMLWALAAIVVGERRLRLLRKAT